MSMHALLLGTCALALALSIGTGKKAAADQVFPDDVIVQGNLCVGLDCVNNETFGFDTVKLKDNNLRIFFQDTSVGPFPTNDWRLIANDSFSGGASYFAIEDATAGRPVFSVAAGAPLNSLFVSNAGNVGLGTSTPAQDLHIATGNTPGLRLEQNASNGWGPQTWDIFGNDASFSVRDVTGGSRLPFRIRPGAPTSSIDIAASGNVGIGTRSPPSLLAIQGGPSPTLTITSDVTTGDAGMPAVVLATGVTATHRYTLQRNGTSGFLDLKGGEPSYSGYTFSVNNGTQVMRIANSGAIRFAGLPNCGSGIQSNANGDLSCIISSRHFKTITGDLKPDVALANIRALRPQTGAYNETPDVPEHWLIAEDVAAVDPALAGFNDGKPYTVKTQNIVADLVAVVQQQQRQIEELRRMVMAKQ